MTSGEEAYLFRHGVMRDAAYQLQLPTERGQLHRIAFDILHDVAGSNVSFAPAAALEISQHARLGQEGLTRKDERLRLEQLERDWLYRAALAAEGHLSPLEACRYWERVSQLSDAPTRMQAEAAFFQGRNLRNAGMPAECERLLHVASTLAARCPDAAIGLRVRLEEAELLRFKGSYADSEARFHEAIEGFRSRKEWRLCCDALFGLHGLLSARRRFDDAEHVLNEAEALSRSCDYPNGVASALGSRGNLCFERHEFDKALDFWRQCEAAAEKAGSERLSLVTRGNRASALLYLARREEAVQCYAQARLDAIALGERLLEISNTINLGIAYFQLERMEEARTCFLAGIALCIEAGKRDSLAFCLACLGRVQIEAGDFGSAVQTFTEEVAHHRALDAGFDLMLAQASLGAALCCQGRHAEGLQELEAARLAYESAANQQDPNYVSLLGWLAEAKYALGKDGSKEASLAAAMFKEPRLKNEAWEPTNRRMLQRLAERLET